MPLCHTIPQLLCARLDGQLSAQEREALDAHLAQCSHCRGLAQELRVISEGFETQMELTPPPDFAQRVMAAVAADANGKPQTAIPWHKRRTVQVLSGLAACVALCAVMIRVGIPGNNMLSSGADGGTGMASQSMENDGLREEITPFAAGGELESADEDAPEQGIDPASVYGALAPADAKPIELVLEQLPDGAQDVLGADVAWSVDTKGQQVCQVSEEIMLTLVELAQAQGIDYVQADVMPEGGMVTVMIYAAPGELVP